MTDLLYKIILGIIVASFIAALPVYLQCGAIIGIIAYIVYKDN